MLNDPTIFLFEFFFSIYVDMVANILKPFSAFHIYLLMISCNCNIIANSEIEGEKEGLGRGGKKERISF